MENSSNEILQVQFAQEVLLLLRMLPASDAVRGSRNKPPACRLVGVRHCCQNSISCSIERNLSCRPVQHGPKCAAGGLGLSTWTDQECALHRCNSNGASNSKICSSGVFAVEIRRGAGSTAPFSGRAVHYLEGIQSVGRPRYTQATASSRTSSPNDDARNLNRWVIRSVLSWFFASCKSERGHRP